MTRYDLAGNIKREAKKNENKCGACGHFVPLYTVFEDSYVSGKCGLSKAAIPYNFCKSDDYAGACSKFDPNWKPPAEPHRDTGPGIPSKCAYSEAKLREEGARIVADREYREGAFHLSNLGCTPQAGAGFYSCVYCRGRGDLLRNGCPVCKDGR